MRVTSEPLSSGSVLSDFVTGSGSMISDPIRLELRHLGIYATSYHNANTEGTTIELYDGDASGELKFSISATIKKVNTFFDGIEQDIILFPGRGIRFENGIYAKWTFVDLFPSRYWIVSAYT
jgi:hypothetical protein